MITKLFLVVHVQHPIPVVLEAGKQPLCLELPFPGRISTSPVSDASRWFWTDVIHGVHIGAFARAHSSFLRHSAVVCCRHEDRQSQAHSNSVLRNRVGRRTIPYGSPIVAIPSTPLFHDKAVRPRNRKVKFWVGGGALGNYDEWVLGWIWNDKRPSVPESSRPQGTAPVDG
jgi:hypothetical protein